jgi:hypothetical protein
MPHDLAFLDIALRYPHRRRILCRRAGVVRRPRSGRVTVNTAQPSGKQTLGRGNKVSQMSHSQEVGWWADGNRRARARVKMVQGAWCRFNAAKHEGQIASPVFRSNAAHVSASAGQDNCGSRASRHSPRAPIPEAVKWGRRRTKIACPRETLDTRHLTQQSDSCRRDPAIVIPKCLDVAHPVHGGK